MLKFIGRGSAFNTKEGNTSAYYKDEENKFMLLIDCGENIFSRIKEHNLLDDVEDLAILITHLHPDHAGSLGTLLFYCKYVLGIKPTIMNYFVDFNEEPRSFAYNLDRFLALQGIGWDTYSRAEYHHFLKNDGSKTICIQSVSSIHVPEIESRGFKIWLRNGESEEYIYYSGDSNDARNIKDNLSNENCVALYIDTCLADYEGNVHLSLRELCEAVPSKEDRKKIHCMHIDCDELIEKAIEKGFNIVEIQR